MDQILEHDKYHILEESRPFAKIVMLVKIEYLLNKAIKVFII
jgi:hypothetical protein